MLRMIFLIVLFFLSTRLIFSQELNWKHLNGPMGGTIGDFAIAANGDIYAGVYWQGWGHEGLYHSSDNGDSWNKVPSPSPDYDFNVYEIYVTKKDHIWIGNADHPDILHRSTNNGETWEIKKNGYIGVECWAIGENKNGILFAGNADGFGGIFKSTDDGENWEFSGNVYPLVIATDSNNVTYAGTFSGLYSTSDNGLSWTKNSFFENITVSSIIIDDKNNIYCGAGYGWGHNGDGIFYSEDGGQNWNQLGLAGMEVLSIAFDSKGSLYAGTWNDGLYKTLDGIIWKSLPNGLYKKNISRIEINKNDDIYIGSEGDWLNSGDGGIFLSTNKGENFNHIGLPISNVRNIVFSGDSLIITATPSGVQKYNRYSQKWRNLGLNKVEAVSITPSNIFYAATYEGLYKSSDFGNTWVLINLSDTIMVVYNVLAINDDTLFAATYNSLRRSTDGGINWDIFPNNTKVILYYNNYLWIIESSSILYKSGDLGNSFQPVYAGFTSSGSINSLSLTDNGYIYLTNWDPNGIIRSKDFGKTFEQILFSDRGIAVSSQEGGLIITGTLSKVYVSTNYGSYWSAFDQPARIRDIKYDQNKNYYFGTLNAGLFEVDIITDVEKELNNNVDFSVYQNYPNPFNPVTHIDYQLKERTKVTLKIFNIMGEEIRTPVDEEQIAGYYSKIFNAENLPSGVYFYELITDKTRVTKKMILLR